jgi:hypothetical protein
MSTTKKTSVGELTRWPDRRTFLSYLSAVPALIGLAGAGLLSTQRAFADNGLLDASERRRRAFVIRRDAAIFQRDVPLTPSHRELHQGFTLGEVDLNAYHACLEALNSGKLADFEAIPLGRAAKLSNPQASLSAGLRGKEGFRYGG